MSEIQANFRLENPGFVLDVNIVFPNRGVTALFGHSGSGKTTFLRCIAGLERAKHGFLSVGGEIWQDHTTFKPVHQRPLGYVFQEVSLFPHLTVLENLSYGTQRIARTQRQDLNQTISLLGIAPLLQRKPSGLSGGERQRVGIARALAVNPRILLMDEPLAALDFKRKQEILPYLENLHHELDIPIIYVSHSPDEVARLADYMVLLENGRALAHGSVATIMTRLDLPSAHDDHASAMLKAIVTQHDEDYQLSRLSVVGGELWVKKVAHPIGSKIRVHVLAHDVSVAIEKPLGSSINNLLDARIDEIYEESSATVLLKLCIGETQYLLARITRRSCDHLGLHCGLFVCAQVKAVKLR